MFLLTSLCVVRIIWQYPKHWCREIHVISDANFSYNWRYNICCHTSTDIYFTTSVTDRYYKNVTLTTQSHDKPTISHLDSMIHSDKSYRYHHLVGIHAMNVWTLHAFQPKVEQRRWIKIYLSLREYLWQLAICIHIGNAVESRYVFYTYIITTACHTHPHW
jgi:hypothetical protein